MAISIFTHQDGPGALGAFFEANNGFKQRATLVAGRTMTSSTIPDSATQTRTVNGSRSDVGKPFVHFTKALESHGPAFLANATSYFSPFLDFRFSSAALSAASKSPAPLATAPFPPIAKRDAVTVLNASSWASLAALLPVCRGRSKGSRKRHWWRRGERA